MPSPEEQGYTRDGESPIYVGGETAALNHLRDRLIVEENAFRYIMQKPSGSRFCLSLCLSVCTISLSQVIFTLGLGQPLTSCLHLLQFIIYIVSKEEFQAISPSIFDPPLASLLTICRKCTYEPFCFMSSFLL